MSTTAATSAESVRLEERYGAHNYHPLDVVISRARGVWVWDVEGNKYLDFLAAYSAVNQGHCHPRIVAALKEQAERVTLTSRAFRNDQLGPFCAELCELTGFSRFLPMNTGAEAVETAIKAARKWAHTVKGVPDDKGEILVFEGNFHGRTTTIVGFSSEEQYRDGFGPFTPGFRVLAVRRRAGGRERDQPRDGGDSGRADPGRERNRRAAGRLPAADCASSPPQTGSCWSSTRSSRASAAPASCSAYEHEGIRPDIVIIGKALGGGCVPISAILADDEVMGVFKPGDHGSTFGGNPLACAVAHAALRALVEEGMIENSARLGDYFIERLRAMKSPHVKEVRGKGLWIGVELHSGGRRRAAVLRGAPEAGPAVQGDARQHDPLRAAARDHPGGDRLGPGANR